MPGKPVPGGTIDTSTHLQERFRFRRDEARDLIDRFAARFQVDMRPFPFDRYFPPQPGEQLLKDTFVRLFVSGERPAEPLTPQDLVDAVRRRCWQEPAPT